MGNQTFYRTVLRGAGIIGTAEPYCEEHVKETNRIGDKLMPTGDYTNDGCVICGITGNMRFVLEMR